MTATELCTWMLPVLPSFLTLPLICLSRCPPLPLRQA
jgi:hypothetical protein